MIQWISPTEICGSRKRALLRMSPTNGFRPPSGSRWTHIELKSAIDDICQPKGVWALLRCFSGMVSTLSKMRVGVLKKGKEGLSCGFGGGNWTWMSPFIINIRWFKLGRPYETTPFFIFSSNFKGLLNLADLRNHWEPAPSGNDAGLTKERSCLHGLRCVQYIRYYGVFSKGDGRRHLPNTLALHATGNDNDMSHAAFFLLYDR
jgi:hypothetical protein